MLLSLESPNAGALVVPLAGAVLPHRYGQGRAVLPGSKNRANGHWGSPENLGGPDASSAASRPEIPGHQLQAPAAHSSAGERKERVNAGGTAKRRQRSAAGGTAGRRSALIVPRKRGHGTRPDRAEGSEASDRGPVGGKYGECIGIRVPCQRNNNG